MNRLALFDCDGTLVDSGANICRAMERSFVRHGLTPPDRGAIHRIVGLSLVVAMAVLHPDGDDALHRELAATYKDAFAAMRGTPDFDHEPLYDGIAGAIAALSADGWLLGVVTGKSDRGLRLVLEQHGLIGQFVTLQTADRHPSKPHPAMALAAMAEAGVVAEHAVVIGDTVFDMEMARAAGSHAVGVAWGYHAPDELLAAGARQVVHHASEIPTALLACLAAEPMSAA